MEILKEIALPVLLSTVSAYLATKAAFRKYKNEKRWDDKREKYAAVIESVEYIEAWYNSLHYSLGIGSRLNNFSNDTSELERSTRLVQKYATIGKLYFSQEFSKVLTALYKDLERLTHEYGEAVEFADGDRQSEFSAQNEYYSSIEKFSNKALKSMLKIAEIDLIKK